MNWITQILVLGIGYLAVFVEAAWDWPRHLLGSQIDLLPSLIVYAALTFGLSTVTLCALVLGFLFDSISANPLGLSSFSFLVVGTAIFWRRELLLRDQIYAQIILGAAASAIAPAISVMLLFLMGYQPIVGWSSLWQLLMMTAGGALLAPIWFKIFARLDKALRYQEVSETTFRPDREIARGRR